MIDRLLAGIDALAVLAARLAAGLLAALFVIGFAELAARAIFDRSLGFALEYSGYLVAHVLLLGSGRALGTGGHIRIALLLDRLPARLRATVDFAATAAAFAAASMLAFALVRYTMETAALDARSYFPTATPLWLPQALLAAGPVILALALLARLVRLLRGEEAET